MKHSNQTAHTGAINDSPITDNAVFPKRTAPEWLIAGMLLLLDASAWMAIYSVATSLRGDVSFSTPLMIIFVQAVQLAVIVGSLFVIGGYNRHTEMRGLSYATEHVLALVSAAIISSFLVYAAATFDQTMKPSRSVLLVSFAIFLPVSLVYRRSIRGMVSASTAGRAFLVVGSGPLAEEFYHDYTNSVNRERLEFVDPERKRVGEHIAGPGSPVIEGDLATKLERLGSGYSGVILAEHMGHLGPELLEHLVRTQFQKVRVYTLEGFHEAHWRHVPVQSIDPFWPLQMGFQLARNSPYHYAKRLFDIALSSVLLVICSPLLGAIALAIWLEDGAPVVFRQPRVGRDNLPFTVLKFRTMKARQEGAVSSVIGYSLMESGTSNDEQIIDPSPSAAATVNHQEPITNNPSPSAEADGDDIYTRPNDPRITKVGRTLRKLRLDELPQLWNVLRGEMSMIGPRAEWTVCAERYEKVIPFYHFRHLVKPGITGWAQVNYPYGESEQDAIEKLKYDLYYIRNYSLKLDLMIVFKTAFTMLFGRGR